jgi:hypothetical protein
MKLSAEIIHERMFADFREQLKKFHKEREEKYFIEFNNKIKLGIINPQDEDYKSVCKNEAVIFANDASQAALDFVKNYIQESADTIIEAHHEGIFDKEEAEIAFNTLKYMLVAAEIENDPKTKLTVR